MISVPVKEAEAPALSLCSQQKTMAVLNGCKPGGFLLLLLF